MNNFPANFAKAGQLKFRPEIESFVLYGVFLNYDYHAEKYEVIGREMSIA